ncbi:MAG: hypothetical protein IJH91_02935 [Mogibacterium sp.]|nr:hypothetical protein [Mogibacterium sp.]
MKKLLALLLSASMTFALAACGKSKDDAPTEEPEEIVEEVADEGETEAQEALPESGEDLFDTSVPFTGAPDKAGFHADTNMLVEDAGFTVSIPRYYGSDEGDADTHKYYAETGDSVVMLEVAFADYTATGLSFEQLRPSMFTSFVNGMALENCVTKNTKSGGCYFEGTTSGLDVRGELDIFYSENAKRYCVVAIIMTTNAKYDYFPDFDKIRKSVVVK